MMKRPLLLLLVPALVGGCRQAAPARVDAPPDSVAGEVAFEWGGGPNEIAIVVPVEVNGEGPFDFVVDTGATLTCVSEELAARLELPEPPGQIGYGAGISGAGRVRLVQIDSLRVGAARAEDLPACALDLSSLEGTGIRLDGLLGLNFMRGFRLSIDFERGTLTLQEPGSPEG